MINDLQVTVGYNQATGRVHSISLNKAPHVLIGGTTGSGKSYLLHSLIAPLLAEFSWRDLTVFLGDPKRVEFACYENDVHVQMIANSPAEHDYMLTQLVTTMEDRYKWMKKGGFKNLENHPFASNILVVIDEFGDLVLDRTMGKKITEKIERLTQLGRAAGIIVVLATQHPTTEVVSSLIKANCPTRIALKVTSAVNSRVILDRGGAEGLEGRGHLLLLSPYDIEIKELRGIDIFKNGYFDDLLTMSRKYHGCRRKIVNQ